jgi:nucleotide-binding universal stress UspA family protein
MKILAAVDGSDYTKRLLAYLAANGDVWLAPAHEYSVLHVVSALPARAAAALDRKVLELYYADEAESVFVPVRVFLEERGVSATYLSEVGPAAELIARTADTGGYDLLMMGSHGHGALGALVLGSVANKVLSHCRTPLLLVR